MTKRDWIYLTKNNWKPDILTLRQKQVLYLIGSGYRTKEISFELALKPETINQHLHAIRKKLGAKTNAHAITLVYEKNASLQ